MMETVQATTGGMELQSIAKAIGQQVDLASLSQVVSADIGDTVTKVWDGDEFQQQEEIRAVLEKGILWGMKVAVGASLKVAAEKGLLKNVPAGTNAADCGDLAHIGVETSKTLLDVEEGRCTPREAVERMADTVASTAVRSCTEKGRKIGGMVGSKVGGAIGKVFKASGPGTVIGGRIGAVIGGNIGYMAGSKVGQKIVAASKKVAARAKEAVVKVAKVATAVVNKVKGFFKKMRLA